MRLLIFGDGLWAANSLLQLSRQGHDLIGIVLRKSPSDCALENAARSLGIPTFQPSNVNEPGFVESVGQMAADLGISISYNQILRRPILNAARQGFVNFHAGKLPYYRGRNVINWAIINGESEIGLTGHLVDEGI